MRPCIPIPTISWGKGVVSTTGHFWEHGQAQGLSPTHSHILKSFSFWASSPGGLQALSLKSDGNFHTITAPSCAQPESLKKHGLSSPVLQGLFACLLPKPEQKSERFFSCWDRGLREVSMHMDVDRKNLVQRSWWIQDRACLLSTPNRSEILLGGVFPFKSLLATKPSLLAGWESSDLNYGGISWSTLSLRIIVDHWAVPSTSMKWRGLSPACHLSLDIRAWHCGAII